MALDLDLDRNVLAFTLGVSIAAGALLGLVPALQSTRPDVADTLKSESAGGGQPGQLRWRNALVVAQLTISLVLLVGAGLFLRSFQQAQAVDPGFGREPAAVMTFLTPTTRFTPDEARAYTRRLLDRFRALPGVEAVGAISNLHLNPLSTQSSDFNVDGFEPPADYGAFVADRAEVDPGFFEAAGIEIGIRMALGADGGRVVRLLVAGGLKLELAGGALGLVLAVAASRLLGGLLFGIDALDPLTFLGVPLVLGAAALLAAWLPARRASRVDPVAALRSE